MKKMLLVLSLVTAAAHAEFFSGNDLYERLTGDAYAKSLAMGYVMGVHDATRSIIHCSSTEATSGQVRDMVMRRLVERPEQRHLAADVLVSMTMKDTWPCPKKDSRPAGTAL